MPIGCTPAPTDLSAPNSAEKFPETDIFWTTRWSARNGIDIYSRPAELVRAAREATGLSVRVGFDNTAKAFPGLDDAGAKIRAGGESLLNPTKFIKDLKGWDFSTFGNFAYTDYINVLDISAERIDAVICEYETKDRFPIPDTDLVFLSVYQISLSNTSGRKDPQDPTSEVDSGQTIEGRGLLPQWDVFEGWTIDSVQSTTKAPEMPDSCIDWFWGSFPDYQSIEDPGRNVVFRMDSPAPHADQYPRWIEAGTLDSRS